jgi:hypothetical protein
MDLTGYPCLTYDLTLDKSVDMFTLLKSQIGEGDTSMISGMAPGNANEREEYLRLEN